MKILTLEQKCFLKMVTSCCRVLELLAEEAAENKIPEVVLH